MYLIRRWRGGLIAAFLVLSLLAAERRVESYGDTLQVILPIAGLGCSIATGDALEYTLRYAIMWTSVRTAKNLLPDELAERPSGGGHGFPSGHTSSAAFGASSLVFQCLSDAPVFKTAIVFGAAFTGASRVEVNAHDIWQILAGGLWGVACERALRRPSRLRARLARLLGAEETA